MSTSIVIPINRIVYVESKIHVIECWNCHVDFGIGDLFMAERRKDHAAFYCPNGHGNYYTQDNEKERLAKQLAVAKQRAQDAEAYTERERSRRLLAERQRAAAKGQVAKIKNRVSKGVCPCCNRSFVNVARHMAGQHPDYAGGDA